MDEPNFESSEWSGHPVASEVAERIRSVIGAAEAAAGAVRHEAEQHAAARRRAGEEEARRLIEDARRDARALLEERVRRINEMSDSIIERAETILTRLDRAAEVRRELQTLVDELGQTAVRLAREVGEEDVAAQAVARASRPVREPEPPRAKPEPEPPRVEVEPEPEPPPEPAPEPEPEPVVEAEAEEEPEPEPEASPPLRVAAEEEIEAASVTEITRPPRTTKAEEDDQLLGARLVALQMAVAGGNRGEVEAHLRRAFDLPNPQSILDDVFGRGTDASKRVVWPSAADGS